MIEMMLLESKTIINLVFVAFPLSTQH